VAELEKCSRWVNFALTGSDFIEGAWTLGCHASRYDVRPNCRVPGLRPRTGWIWGCRL